VLIQAYENYSFEELRFASPTLRRPTENMLIRDNDDGTYTASWTPAVSGLYHIQVKLDDFDAGLYVSTLIYLSILFIISRFLDQQLIP